MLVVRFGTCLVTDSYHVSLDIYRDTGLAVSTTCGQAFIALAADRTKTERDEIMQQEHGEAVDSSNILMGALDAANFPDQDDSADKVQKTGERKKTKRRRDRTVLIREQLQQLEWERVLIYIRGWNAHASIVCRVKRFTNPQGRAAVQHFIDTAFSFDT